MRFKIEFRPDILKFIGISSAGILIGFFLFFFIEPMGVLGFILILGGFIGLLIALFVAFMGPVFAIASILYIWTYHRYEKGADENQD